VSCTEPSYVHGYVPVVSRYELWRGFEFGDLKNLVKITQQSDSQSTNTNWEPFHKIIMPTKMICYNMYTVFLLNILSTLSCSHENVSYYRATIFFLAKVLIDLSLMRILPLCVYCCIVYFMVGKSTKKHSYTVMHAPYIHTCIGPIAWFVLQNVYNIICQGLPKLIQDSIL
jgi:hypothetical protein